MERWSGKVAVVTGASAGIGLAIAKALIREGLTVVGLAFSKDEMLNKMESVKGPGKFVARECDVTKEKDVVETFDFIKDSFKTVHILVNNAGIGIFKSFEEVDLKEVQDVINVNLVGLVHCSKQAIKLMKENDHEAHIININSVAGHKVPNFTLPDGTMINSNIYSPTKFAVTSVSEVLTNELRGGKIRVTNEMESVKGPGKFVARECDIAKEKDVIETFDFIKDSFKTVHILINNAGTGIFKTFEEADLKEVQDIINVNLVGLVHCSKQAIKLMKENDHEAHIININSVAGHKVPNFTLPDGTKIGSNIYSPTKFAVTSLSEVLTNELRGGKIRVTSLSPGYVLTEFGGSQVDDALSTISQMPPHLNPKDIADAVVYVVGTPHHVQITELTIRPLGETF